MLNNKTILITGGTGSFGVRVYPSGISGIRSLYILILQKSETSKNRQEKISAQYDIAWQDG